MKKLLLIIMALMIIGVTSCESNSKGETPPDDTPPSVDPIPVDDTRYDNSALNVYIWQSNASSTFYQDREIAFIKKAFSEQIQHPELIHYEIITQTTVQDFGRLVNAGDCDIVLAGANMDEADKANIKLRTDEGLAKEELHESYYIYKTARYAGAKSTIADEKIATAKLFLSMLKEESKYPSLSILIIGNSYTYYNDLYRMYGELLESKGINAQVSTLTGSGAFFSDYVEGGQYHDQFIDRLTNNQYDYIYLQEQSSRAIKNYSGFLADGKELAQTIRAKQDHAEIILYGTWARDERNSFYTENPKYTYYSAAYGLADNYKALGRVIEAKVAFCGLGFYEIYTNHKEIELYQTDWTHPSPRGSYLVALTFAKTTFDIDPLTVTYLPSYTTSIGADKVMPTEAEASVIKQVVHDVEY